MPKPSSPARAWSRPLADLVGAAIDPVLARQGFSESQIVLYWDEIVGERLAAASEPLLLKWPPGGATRRDHLPATLVIRVETGFALELQHAAPVVVDRVNSYMGFGCVDRIALRQGPVVRPWRRASPPAASVEATSAAVALVGDIGDPALRAALTRLGARIIQHSLDRKLAT